MDSIQNSLFDATYADEYLAEVERRVANKVKSKLAEYNKHDPALLLPSRIVHSLSELLKVRDTLLYGIPDLFFYISEDGEQVIRNRLFKAISDAICFYQDVATDAISPSIIGHSAGSVIAHDFLYHLSGKTENQIAMDEQNSRKRQAAIEITKLRRLKQNGRLRIRRFYTFGSPITALMIRSNSLLHRMMHGSDGEKLDPRDLGLQRDDALLGPRWVNFWDVDDYASFPIEPFYKGEEELVKDEYVDYDLHSKSDIFPYAHQMYWESEYIAHYIAKNF